MMRIAKTVILSVALAMAAAAHGAMAETIWPEPTTPPQINVTTDSAPGWLPSAHQAADVRKVADAFLAAKDDGRAADAYALMGEGDRQGIPFPAFAEALSSLRTKAGALTDRRITTVTWTKDPAHAPAPGVYAALDLVSHYANVDRYCGYLILYQAPTGGSFQIVREETAFMDNATAGVLEKQQSMAGVDKAWSEASARGCPGYHIETAPLAEAQGSTVGYATVAEALQALHAKAGVVFSTQAGWTIAQDSAAETFWSFPPPGDPAYPSAVKRQLIHNGGSIEMTMSVLCGSTKAACDHLVRQFQQLNAQMKASLAGH
jgi:Protein of unknown function (DUF4019)